MLLKLIDRYYSDYSIDVTQIKLQTLPNLIDTPDSN